MVLLVHICWFKLCLDLPLSSFILELCISIFEINLIAVFDFLQLICFNVHFHHSPFISEGVRVLCKRFYVYKFVAPLKYILNRIVNSWKLGYMCAIVIYHHTPSGLACCIHCKLFKVWNTRRSNVQSSNDCSITSQTFAQIMSRRELN